MDFGYFFRENEVRKEDAVIRQEMEQKTMENEKVYQMTFVKVYPLLVNKAQRKGRSKEEVDELAKGKAMDKILRKEESVK